MNASQANPQPSRRITPALVARLVLLSAIILPFLPVVHAQSAYTDVPIPNGNLNISATDLSQQTAAGALNFRREWNGGEWKFQPNWVSLSQSWTNLTGSQTADSTRPTVAGQGAALPRHRGNATGNGECAVYADEDWQPQAGASLIATRTTPFNQKLLSGQTPGEYAPAKEVSVNYASLCIGVVSGGFSFEHAEGLRRGNELQLGNNGTYTFGTQSLLRKTAIWQLPAQTQSQLNQLTAGHIPLTPENNPKGYRWQNLEGAWIHYNTQGQVVAYGDKNDNTIWLIRDTEGKLQGVADHTGRVLISLHYTGDLLTEIRDYPGNANDLPIRSVHYQYDHKNRLTQVTDVRGNATRYAYDDGNQITEITDQEGRVEKFSYLNRLVRQRIAADGGTTDYRFDYDDVHKQYLSQVTGPETEAGRRKERYTHNQAGQLVQKTLNGLIETEIQRDTSNRVERIINSRGYATTYKRNEFGQVIETEYPDGSMVKRKYAIQNHQLEEETDELNIKTRYQYDGKGNLIRKIEAAGTEDERTTEYERNEKGQITQVTRKGRTESNGATTPDAIWRISYDESGQLQSMTDPEGGVRSYTNNRAGNLVSATDPKGNVTRYEVDTQGNLTKVINPLGHTRTYAYDKVGNPTSETDAKGKATLSAYDAVNRLTKTTRPMGGTSQTQYDADGLPIEQTDEDGRKTRQGYDSVSRLIKQIDGGGNITEHHYEISDNTNAGLLGSFAYPTETKYPTFTEHRRLDQRENLVSQTMKYRNTLGEQMSTDSTTYDKRGRVLTETDANGKTIAYAYDGLGQQAQYTDSLGNVAKFDYDAHGNLSKLIDAKGNVYQFKYNRNNRVTQKILPLGQTTQYQYDVAGTLTQKTDPNGHKTTYSFDVGKRPISIQRTDSNGTLVRTTTYAWDANDNLTGWTDIDHSRNQTSSASLSYDANNQKIQETVTYPDGHSQSYGYDYSAAGKKTKLIWADGTEIGYGYSAHGELNSVSIPDEGIIQINEYGWLAPKKITLPGGTTQNKGYDGLLNLENFKVQTPAEILNLANTYGKQQELTKRSRTDTASNTSNSKNETFSYDDELRLTKVETEGWLWNDAETFTLDAVGNRTQHSKTSNPWTYDNNNRLLKIGEGNCGSANTICYDYDEAGNQTKKTEQDKTTNYRYDTQNRLIEVSQTTNGTEQLLARYSYDPFNRRLAKEQYGNKDGQAVQAKRTYFLYSDEGLLAEETQNITLNADGSTTTNGQPEITTQYGVRPDSEFTTGILFVKTKNTNNEDTVAYYHHDHLNTPVQATDKNGNIVWSASYNAFGKATITTPQATQDKPTIASSFRLPGQYEDSETGLYYNWNRHYSPEEGRYITSDPIGLSGGLNLYAYVTGSPTVLYDANGLRFYRPSPSRQMPPRQPTRREQKKQKRQQKEQNEEDKRNNPLRMPGQDADDIYQNWPEKCDIMAMKCDGVPIAPPHEKAHCHFLCFPNNSCHRIPVGTPPIPDHYSDPANLWGRSYTPIPGGETCYKVCKFESLAPYPSIRERRPGFPSVPCRIGYNYVNERYECIFE